MSGLGEGGQPDLDKTESDSIERKGPRAHDVLDEKIDYMEEHIKHILDRNLGQKNPDITESILEKLVNGGPREHTMALAQLYWNAADRMNHWSMDRRKKYNSRPLLFSLSFKGRIRQYQMKAHKYKMMHIMMSPNYEAPDRAVIEYIVTSEEEI